MVTLFTSSCDHDDATSPLFAHVTSDCRINVWDATTGNLNACVQEQDHLRKVYTSISIDKKTVLRKESTLKNTSSTWTLLAAGDSQGRIILWDISNEKLLCSKLVFENKSSVDGLYFSPNCGALYSCGLESKYVLELQVVPDGNHNKLITKRNFRVGKGGASRVCFSPNGRFLIAGGMKLFRWGCGEWEYR